MRRCQRGAAIDIEVRERPSSALPGEESHGTEIDDMLASARPAGRKMPTLVIADRHEIAGAGLERLNIIGRWSHEDEL